MTTFDLDLPEPLARAVAERRERTGESLPEIVLAALANELGVAHQTLFQVSTAVALAEGVSRGAVSVSELKKRGDFGIGTFDRLDGELIAIDGRFYRATAAGDFGEAPDDALAPFAVVTEFQPDETFSLEPTGSFAALTGQLDAHRRSDNLFYAARLRGWFESARVRVFLPAAPGESLAEAAKRQREHLFTGVDGEIVAFWTPGYAGTINVAGWHLHFITADRAAGGHLLACRAGALGVEMQEIAEVEVEIPETAEYLTADLTGDPADELEAAERDHDS